MTKMTLAETGMTRLEEVSSGLEEAREALLAALGQLEADQAMLDWLLAPESGCRILPGIWEDAAKLCPVDAEEASDTRKWGRLAIQARMRKEAK